MGNVKLEQLNQKLKASTLVEAIIAMLIITVTFSLGLLLMLNISKNSNNSLKTKAYILANDVLVKSKSENLYLDQEYNYGNITIKKAVSEYENNEELFQLNISAFDSRNYKLFEQNELIIIEKNE